MQSFTDLLAVEGSCTAYWVSRSLGRGGGLVHDFRVFLHWAAVVLVSTAPQWVSFQFSALYGVSQVMMCVKLLNIASWPFKKQRKGFKWFPARVGLIAVPSLRCSCRVQTETKLFVSLLALAFSCTSLLAMLWRT